MKLTLHRKRRVESAIDLTPMLDTLLQVHIAFMFLMSFAASSVKLDLPRAAASEHKPTVPVVVSLNAKNDMYLNEDIVLPADLGARLGLLFAQRNNRAVTLRADQSLPYRDVVKALRVIGEAGAEHVDLAYDNDR